MRCALAVTLALLALPALADDGAPAGEGPMLVEHSEDDGRWRWALGAGLSFTSEGGPRVLSVTEVLYAPRTLAWWPGLRLSTSAGARSGLTYGADMELDVTSVANGGTYAGEREYLLRTSALLYADHPLPTPRNTLVPEHGLRLGAGFRLDAQGGGRQLHLAGRDRFLWVGDLGAAVGPRLSAELGGLLITIDSFVGLRTSGLYAGGGLGLLVPLGG